MNPRPALERRKWNILAPLVVQFHTLHHKQHPSVPVRLVGSSVASLRHNQIAAPALCAVREKVPIPGYQAPGVSTSVPTQPSRLDRGLDT
mmetsp:Transcript_145067/g.253012  ORF Transcript_145067/g.253012 Transcript_145067/m.253012 type:complete len:90 (-) Transcript_145067:84-353(-)